MNPRRSSSSLPRPGRSAYGAATAAALLLIPAIVLLGGDGVRDFLNFGAGVLSLVALSCSVIWGLVATDRVFLNARQRIVAQAVHRTTAVSSVAFLLLHVTVKLATDHTTLLAALIPFSLGVTGSAGLIGFGSLAALLMITTALTGALRSAFATPAPVAARWRAFHMLAYPAWCFALIHGLYAGREAKPVFVTLYCLCLAGVAGALALRSAPRPFKRKVADRVMGVLGTESRPGREELDASRARVAGAAADTPPGAVPRARGGGSPLPGYGARGGSAPDDPLFPGGSAIPPQRTPSPDPYESAVRADAPGTRPGFAAAYRTVSAFPRAGDPSAPWTDRPAQSPPAMPPTQAVPRLDDGSTGGRWPVPSPPPVGEAPPSAYDPMQDTFAGTSFQAVPEFQAIPENSYETAETTAPYGTYNTNDTYDSGPATETLPGGYGAPGSGEPWNMPSGGHK
ncbi:membrane protein [Streptomyces ruber]|uniref:Membrane protein n=2 Tax=Streptomyces TaxID=1883 RepID=A0A918BBB5_9ACTN|nr:ferric reductase-like transmembrane domain-containing protein [Streptomyces ruber]GGQ55969.1 membrane protein [Streptomyces ruber]